MASLPHPEESMIDRIYESYEKEDRGKELYLARIGASSIGEECLRSLWLSWRAYDDKKFGGRMLRLFQTGHLQEDRIIADMRRAGYDVWSHDEDGKQFTYTDETGHFVCKLDGVVKGVPGAEKTPHDLEVKTHSKKSYEELKKKNVEKAKPLHYAQMQAGMLFSGINRALYVALCKDDEDYHIERLRPDEAAQQKVRDKIITLVNASIPPQGISTDGGAFGCKWCDMRAVCVGEKEPIRTCRSCVHAEVVKKDGIWACGLTGEVLSQDAQRTTCDNYEVLK